MGGFWPMNAVLSLFRSISIAASLVGEDAKTKFLSKMGQLTTSGAMLANVFQRKKWELLWVLMNPPLSWISYLKSIACLSFVRLWFDRLYFSIFISYIFFQSPKKFALMFQCFPFFFWLICITTLFSFVFDNVNFMKSKQWFLPHLVVFYVLLCLWRIFSMCVKWSGVLFLLLWICSNCKIQWIERTVPIIMYIWKFVS